VVSAEPVLTQEQKDANVLAVVQIALEELKGAAFDVRRRGVMFIATLLGHRIGREQLRDQEWGVVGQCERCGQVAKAKLDGDSIEGRATNTVCPARGR